MSCYGFLKNISPSTKVQIPNEFVPKYSYPMLMVLQSSNPYTPIVTSWIDTNGELAIYLSSTSSLYIGGTYMIL